MANETLQNPFLPEDETQRAYDTSDLMLGGAGLGGAAFAAQTGRAPTPVPPKTPPVPFPSGKNVPTNPLNPATGPSGGTKLPPQPSLAQSRAATRATLNRAAPTILGRAGSFLGPAATSFLGGYTVGSVVDKAFDISGNIARAFIPNAPTLTREERAALGRPGVEAISDMVARPGDTEQVLLGSENPLSPVQATGQQMVGQAGVPNMNELVSGMQAMGQPSAVAETPAQPVSPQQVISDFGALTGVPNLENVSTAMQNPGVFTPASQPATEAPVQSPDQVDAPSPTIDATFESGGQTMAIPSGGSFQDRFVPTAEQLAQFQQQQQEPAPGTPQLQEFAGGTVAERPEGLTSTIDPTTGQAVFADPRTAMAMGQEELAQRQRDFEAQQRAIQELAGSDVGFQRMAGDEFARASREREARLMARPDFNRAMSDRERRGGELSQSELRRIAKGQARGATANEQAEAMQILQRRGYDPVTGKPEPTQAEKTKEQLEIEYIQGRIDNLAPTASEQEKDKLQNELLNLQIQEAKESLKPDDIEVVVKGGWSYVTKNGKYQIGRFVDLNDKTPAALQTADGVVQRIQDARDLYNKGDTQGAQDILSALEIKDTSGLPAQANDYFGGGTPAGGTATDTAKDYGFGEENNARVQLAVDANPDASVLDIIKAMISQGKL